MYASFVASTELGVDASGRREMVGNNLRFLGTELSDTGKYECKAGQAIANMVLTVISKLYANYGFGAGNQGPLSAFDWLV